MKRLDDPEVSAWFGKAQTDLRMPHDLALLVQAAAANPHRA